MSNALVLAELTAERAALRLIGAGPSFPFRFSTVGDVKSVELAHGMAKINQAIHMILSTSRGSRVNRPTFGCFAGETGIRLLSGAIYPISGLTQSVRSFGVMKVPSNDHHPEFHALVPCDTLPVSFMGTKPVITVKLSNDKIVRCTADHRFLLSDCVNWVEAGLLWPGASLAWFDPTLPDLYARRLAWRKMQRDAFLCRMPMTRGALLVEEVVDLGESAEVYDLPNSSTGSYALGVGPIVHNSNLNKLVFEPHDEILWPLLVRETARAIRDWEPRIRVVRVEPVSPSSLSASGVFESFNADGTREALDRLRDTNTIGIFIQYEMARGAGLFGNYVYPFQRQTAPLTHNVGTLGRPGSFA